MYHYIIYVSQVCQPCNIKYRRDVTWKMIMKILVTVLIYYQLSADYFHSFIMYAQTSIIRVIKNNHVIIFLVDV